MTTSAEFRLRVMANHCRKRGGDCDCPGDCKAVIAVGQELCKAITDRGEAENRVRALEGIHKRLTTPPATLREGFTFHEGLTPVMVFDGDEACFGYEDADGEWIEANVWADDCERLGIKVETA